MKSATLYIKEAWKFVKQVIQEGHRVTWPTRRDVVVTSIMVFVLSVIFSIFFFFVDKVIYFLIHLLLGA